MITVRVWLVSDIRYEHASESFKLETFHLCGSCVITSRGLVVELDEMDDIGDGEHAGKAGLGAVP